MPELIERNAILLDINEEITANQEYPEDQFIRKGLRIARECIENAPIIEAEPLRHGRWICDHNGIFFCNVCGYPRQIGAKDFCGKCGAKMDGGADNS